MFMHLNRTSLFAVRQLLSAHFAELSTVHTGKVRGEAMAEQIVLEIRLQALFLPCSPLPWLMVTARERLQLEQQNHHASLVRCLPEELHLSCRLETLVVLMLPEINI